MTKHFDDAASTLFLLIVFVGALYHMAKNRSTLGEAASWWIDEVEFFAALFAACYGVVHLLKMWGI